MNINSISANPDIVFISLRTMKQSDNESTPFYLETWFWEGLVKIGILSETINNIPLVNRVQEVCINSNHLHQYKLGIMDFSTTDTVRYSENSVALINSACDLFKLNINLKYAKIIILIGENALQLFKDDFPTLGTINSIPLESIHDLELYQQIKGIKPGIKKSFNENNLVQPNATTSHLIDVDGFKIEIYYLQTPLKSIQIF
jgi:hypothetical protein